MKLKFGVQERLLIGGLLPDTGNITALKLIREFKEALSFNEKEHKELGIRQDEGMIYWDQTKEKAKTIEVSEVIIEMIKKQLKEMDKNEQLLEAHIPIYDKFMDAEEDK